MLNYSRPDNIVEIVFAPDFVASYYDADAKTQSLTIHLQVACWTLYCIFTVFQDISLLGRGKFFPTD